MMRPPVRSVGGVAVRLVRAWWPQVAALAAASGIVAATIGGALGVGDAMVRGLSRQAQARLGRIDTAVLGQDFFRPQLAAEVAAGLASRGMHGVDVVPAIVLDITVEVPGRDGSGRAATRATLLACDDPAALGFDPPPPPLLPDAVAVNGPLAEVLGVITGDALVLRLADRSAVPADSPLGRRLGESMSRRMTVSAVLPPGGIGEFSLRPTQVTSGLVLASRETVQRILRREAAANALLCVGSTGGRAHESVNDAVRDCLAPSLDDLGFSLDSATDAALRLTSRRLILEPAVDRAAEAVLRPRGGQPTLLFLATSIATPAGDGSIPYSTLLGIESTRLPVGDLVDESGMRLPLPTRDEIVIDRWMADDLAAQAAPITIGDELLITTFRPETLHGRVEEQTHRLRVSGIAAMRGAAVARDLVPDVEGITDEASIADWDPPFPFDRSRVRSTPPHDEDERYWKDYRATPKAFVSLDTARRIAGSRFGMTTAWHVPSDRVADAAALRTELTAGLEPEQLGLRVSPVAGEAAAAARGSTPFGGLFLGLSLVIVVAGLLLEWLLFHLLVAAHHRDLGILTAVGWPTPRLRGLLLRVAAVAVIGGAVSGAIVAPVWATALVATLGRAWNASVASGSQQVFGAAAPRLAAIWPGAVAAAVISLAAVWWAARRVARAAPRRLLQGMAGAAVLGGRIGPVRSLAGLACRGVMHRWQRALSIVALVGLAEFLIVVVSAFALRPPLATSERTSPTGGYTHIVTFGEPTGIDPTDPGVVDQLGLSTDEQSTLARCTIARIRSNRGDDASCTNLYAATRPTLLGVGDSFIDRGGFRFVAHAPLAAESANPWKLLRRTADDADPVIPAILDQATAQWALKLGGVGARFVLPSTAARNGPTYEIVGLLEPGILQGAVIVSEENFLRVEPQTSGYGMAVVDCGDMPVPAASQAIAAAWADAAVSVQVADDRLRSLYAVQNTFLAGFQALGTLGILIGTLGVAAVQMQGVFERLGPLSLLRAVGFTLARVRWLIVLETVLMVGVGVVAGAAAALVTLAAVVARGQAVIPWGWLAASATACLLSAVIAGMVATRRDTIPIRPHAD